MMKREKMTGMQEALSRPVAMGLLALFCCALWGSAFPCIKIGYRLFQISAGDTGSVILFAGLRFALAGIMVILAGSAMQGRRLVPRRGDIVKIAKLCTFHHPSPPRHTPNAHADMPAWYSAARAQSPLHIPDHRIDQPGHNQDRGKVDQK